jgi:hypothetical protein
VGEVKSRVTRGFWKLFEQLPKQVQTDARSLHLIWRSDPFHASLHFKKVGVSEGIPVYSIRIGRKWRALGILEDDTVKWFWIGSHEAYNKIIKQL